MKKFVLAVMGLLVVVGAGMLLLKGRQSARPPVTLVFQVQVAPPSEIDYVIQQANTAKFKYLVGKQAGVKPAFAQRLQFRPEAGRGLIEVRAGTENREQAQRYRAAFLPALQWQCGTRARLTLMSE